MTERVDSELQMGERQMLDRYLDDGRATMRRLVDGLTKEQMAMSLSPSDLTLGGLVKHLALVEDAWFVETFLGEQIPEPWTPIDWDADPDWEFRTALDDTPEHLLGLYDIACGRARSIVAAAESLDALSVGLSRREDERGQQFSLRWIILHMIEETARHLGQADLIRQSIDGVTGL